MFNITGFYQKSMLNTIQRCLTWIIISVDTSQVVDINFSSKHQLISVSKRENKTF